MNAYLPIGLPLAPSVYRRLTATIPASRYDEELVEGRFTPREVIAHVADWEPILRERMKTAIASPGAAIQGIDEGQMAIDHNYKGSNVEEQLRIFERERKITTEFINGLTPEDYDKFALHSERGRITVADMANMLLGHDIYHLDQLSAYLEEKSAGTW